jgi:mannose-6-phosphate isomerase
VGHTATVSHPPFTRTDRAVPPLTLEPTPLRPQLRRRPWGGSRLSGLWDAGAAGAEPGVGPFGEAWLAGPDARLEGGPRAGATLAEVAAELGPALVGTAPFERYGARFPLLVKLLDAAEPLSLQVHPDDAYALRHEPASGHLGKTEAWWVLAAERGATVWWGFDRPTDRAEVERAAQSGHLGALLRVLPVAAGDVVVNPAGTVHALGAGLTVYEVQQASDLTYRLDDHGRVGPDGRARELHLTRALDVASFVPGGRAAPPRRASGVGRTELAGTHAFVLERLTPAAAGAGVAWSVDASSCQLLTHLPFATGGAGTLAWEGGEARMEAHATWLLPAGLGEVRLRGGGTFARVWVPSPASATADRAAS